MSSTTCSKHNQPFSFLCLAEDCKEDVFLCKDCRDSNFHKHSKTDIQVIEEIKEKLKNAWEPKNSIVEPYFKACSQFYDALRKQIAKLIDQDQKNVECFLTKVKYHHLPSEANSQAYLELIKQEYDRLDKASILKLINEADNGELNKNLSKQKQITNFLDIELKKINEKILTLKYVLLSKKFETQLLAPNLSEQSLVANQEQFTKIYSLFNSRQLLIRSAKLIYRGSDNQYSAKSFYNQCNGIPNCIAISRTKNNKLVGGFTPLPLVHHDEEELAQQHWESDKTKKSFIFSITSLRSFSLKDSSKAIKYSQNQKGPCFGPDLTFTDVITSNLGHSYEPAPGVGVDSVEAQIYLLDDKKGEIKEIQIWQLSF